MCDSSESSLYYYYKTRCGATDGSWLSFLPSLSLYGAVLVTAPRVTTPQQIYETTLVTFMIFAYALILLQDKTPWTSNVTKLYGSWFLSLTIPSAAAFMAKQNCFHAVLVAIMAQLIFFNSLQLLLKKIPWAFTWGEASAVAAFIVLFVDNSRKVLLNNQLITMNKEDDYIVAKVIVTIGGLLVPVLGWIHYKFRPPLWIGLLILVTSGQTLTWLLFRISPITWIIPFVFGTRERILLLGIWIICIGITLGALYWQIMSGTKGSTMTRKTFHFLIFVVFASGIRLDTTLLYLACGLTLSLFILVEIVRWREKSGPLQWAFEVFAGEHELEGNTALPAIYLIGGCSMPVLLLAPVPPRISLPAVDLLLISGAMSIGVGDACASIIGKKYGTHRIGDSSRTYEGTLACVISQWIVMFLFDSNAPLVTYIVPIFTSLVEGHTSQIDNLALPLLTFPSFLCLLIYFEHVGLPSARSQKL